MVEHFRTLRKCTLECHTPTGSGLQQRHMSQYKYTALLHHKVKLCAVAIAPLL